MLNPATILLLVQGIQAAIAAEPQVAALAVEAKNFIAGLFYKGLISKATQDAIHAHVDAICAAAQAGQEGPEFTIEPDPS
ncbi:MAG TPA: hypothetical protein VHA37_04545 [Candidatus Saccharimonadales bacterium]|nr:hypothetical protein [Candidatus Saccharimonadales bacterium]